MFQDPAVFLVRNGTAYNLPANAPPDTPHIPVGTMVLMERNLCAQHAIESKNWAIYKRTRRLIVDLGRKAFEDFVYAELDGTDEGLDGVEIRDLHDHVMDRFALILQEEIDENLCIFNIGIYPTKPLTIYTRKQELCQETPADANVAISEATMVTTITKHAVPTGGMEATWREWMTQVHDPLQAAGWPE